MASAAGPATIRSDAWRTKRHSTHLRTTDSGYEQLQEALKASFEKMDKDKSLPALNGMADVQIQVER